MAYSFGGGINPQLGATDYSAVLRGAQNYAQSTAAGSAAIGQGIGSALASLGGAVQQYYDKKEKKEMDEQAFNVAKNILRDNPEAQRLFGIRDMNDEKLIKSVVKTAGAPTILSIASQFDRQQKESKAIQAAMAAGPSQAQRSIMGGARFEDLSGASFAPAPVGASEFLSRYAGAGGSNLGAAVNAAQLVGGNQVDPLARQKMLAEIENLNARTAQLGQPQGMSAAEQERINIEKQRLAMQQADVANKATEKAVKAEEMASRDVERVAQFKADIAQAVKTVNEAISLSSGGAAGPISGLPVVRDVTAAVGASAAKQLNSKYNTIKAVMKLQKLQQMKELSKNSASGLGQLSDREGAALEAAVAELDPTLPESTQLNNLKTIRGYLMRLGSGALSKPVQIGRFTVTEEQ